MKRVTIYSLTDPRTGLIRYVGKTVKPVNFRLSHHLTPIARIGCNSVRINWIIELEKQGLKPIIEELDSCLPEDNWADLEKYWIHQCISWGFPLTNSLRPSKETIRNRAEKITGVPRPEWVKQKISDTHRGKQLSVSHRRRVKELSIQLWGKKVQQFNSDDKLIKEWPSISSIVDELHYADGWLRKAINQGFKAYNCIWKFKV